MTDSNIIPFPQKDPAPIVFSFGDPEQVLSKDISDYTGSFLDLTGVYYNPPVSWSGVAKLMGANAYHGAILSFKRNMVCKWFQPSPLLSTRTLRYAAMDYVTFGNAYLQKIKNALGNVIRLERLPAIAMRRGKEPGKYIQLNREADLFNPVTSLVVYQNDEVIHLKNPDVRQNIYGIPEYLGGIQAVLLSEDSTLFRRRYYLNGAHMGYILVTTDANISDTDAKNIENKVKQSKGIGNFSSLYLNIPRTTAKEPVQLIPVGDIGSKDQYSSVKDATEQEILAAHRMPPTLISVIPVNAGGLGNPQLAMQVYHELEVQSLQQIFLDINDEIRVKAVSFDKPDWSGMGIVPPVANPPK